MARSGSCMLLYDDGAGAGGEVGLVVGGWPLSASQPGCLGGRVGRWGERRFSSARLFGKRARWS